MENLNNKAWRVSRILLPWESTGVVGGAAAEDNDVGDRFGAVDKVWRKNYAILN